VAFGWASVLESAAVPGILAVFGVAFAFGGAVPPESVPLTGLGRACPGLGCFFVSVPVLLVADGAAAVPAPVAAGFDVPLPDFSSVPVLSSLLLLAGVGEDVPAGTAGGKAPGVLGAFGSCLGTLGSLCDRMSAARMGAGPDAADRELSAISVMTSTSSNRVRSAAGLILITRNGSLSWSAMVPITVPTAYPLG